MTQDLQYRDRVAHKKINQTMTVIGVGEINGQDLAWCEWTTANGETTRRTFPIVDLIKQ